MWIVAFAVALLLVPTASAAQQPSGTARVAGVVVRADTGTPLARATVRLFAPRSGGWQASSDDAGRFELTGLPAGRYALSARKAGYITTGIVRNAVQRSGTVELRDGEAVQGVVIRMLRGGAIEGRIVDEHGEPAVEAYVRALQSEYVQGGRRLAARHTAQTNDLGEYRLYGLPPGRYYVAAALRSMDLAAYDPQKPSPQVMRGASGFAPTFFPGTAVPADASAVRVRAGEDVPGVDFGLRSVRLARISGVVLNSRGAVAPDNVVMLNPASGRQDLNFVEAGADGTFVFADVAPGEYRLDVQAKAALEAVAQSGRSGIAEHVTSLEYASVPLTVSGADVEGLRLVTRPGRRLAGRIVVEGAATSADVVARLRIGTVDRSAGLALSAVLFGAGAPVQPDGTFEVRGVSGVREVRVSGLPQGWALKAVNVSGMDVTDAGVEIRDDDVSGVEVVVTATPAQISGSIVDQMNRPIGGVGVIVFPEDRLLWAAPPNRHLASATAAADGTFRISPLPAGDYLIALVEELVDGEWAEPENLERLSASATKISLADGEQRTLTLRR